MLPNEKAILLIRGEKPVVDFKYDILKHPNVKYTTDGEGKIYEHGIVSKATGTIAPVKLEELLNLKNIKNIKDTKEMKELDNTSYEILSDEDIENYIMMEEYENERKQESKKDEN